MRLLFLRQTEDVPTAEASVETEDLITSQEQDPNAAGIPVEVAREQHPISEATDTETISVTKSGASDGSAKNELLRKCPVTTCAYHLVIRPWPETPELKSERNNHIMTHYEGKIEFGTNSFRYSLPWPKFVEDPEQFIHDLQILKRNVKKYVEDEEYVWIFSDEPIRCFICDPDFGRYFDSTGYVEHLDDCIIHAVQVRASGAASACPMPLCDHYPVKAPSSPHENQQIIQPYWPLASTGPWNPRNQSLGMDRPLERGQDAIPKIIVSVER